MFPLQVWEVKRGGPGDYLLKNSEQSLHNYLPVGTRVAILLRSGCLAFLFISHVPCHENRLVKRFTHTRLECANEAKVETGRQKVAKI